VDGLSEMLKGVLPGIVLTIIGRGEVYGYEIVKKLSEIGFDTAEGTVYTILMRMEKADLVHITKKPSAIGPPRKFYRLNGHGERALSLFWQRWNFLCERIDFLQAEGSTAQ